MQDVDLGSHFVVATVSLLIVIGCVLLHYESLSLLTGVLKRIRIRPRPRILAAGAGGEVFFNRVGSIKLLAPLLVVSSHALVASGTLNDKAFTPSPCL